MFEHVRPNRGPTLYELPHMCAKKISDVNVAYWKKTKHLRTNKSVSVYYTVCTEIDIETAWQNWTDHGHLALILTLWVSPTIFTNRPPTFVNPALPLLPVTSHNTTFYSASCWSDFTLLRHFALTLPQTALNTPLRKSTNDVSEWRR